jgi:translation elongation factor P/translation initiation factor 5A
MKVNRHSIMLVCSMMLVVPVSSIAVAQADEVMMGVHYGFSGVISKIESGMLFVKTPDNLQMRTISPNKADRVGLHEAKPGDTVLMMVDSGNVLLDVTKAGQAFAEHRMIVGTLHYADPYWNEIQISTPEGFERFDVDALAGSKLSVIQDGAPVTVELDADNVMIDIHRSR